MEWQMIWWLSRSDRAGHEPGPRHVAKNCIFIESYISVIYKFEYAYVAYLKNNLLVKFDVYSFNIAIEIKQCIVY